MRWSFWLAYLMMFPLIIAVSVWLKLAIGWVMDSWSTVFGG